MRYFLDCEFDGWNGPLLSLALVPEFGDLGFYVTYAYTEVWDKWVEANVKPLLEIDLPKGVRIHRKLSPRYAANAIADYLKDDPRPYIATDWPDDVRYFCGAVITDPGKMASIPSLRFEVVRVDAYPTGLPNARQHHAWWDAMALRHLLLPDDSALRPPLP